MVTLKKYKLTLLHNIQLMVAQLYITANFGQPFRVRYREVALQICQNFKNKLRNLENFKEELIIEELLCNVVKKLNQFFLNSLYPWCSIEFMNSIRFLAK